MAMILLLHNGPKQVRYFTLTGDDFVNVFYLSYFIVPRAIACSSESVKLTLFKFQLLYENRFLLMLDVESLRTAREL